MFLNDRMIEIKSQFGSRKHNSHAPHPVNMERHKRIRGVLGQDFELEVRRFHVAPGIEGNLVHYPRWAAYDPRFFTVTGPQGTADALELDDGRLRLRHGVHHAGRLQITVTAPGVHEFTVAGSGDMRLEGLDQDSVAIKIFGSGDITAKGKARDLEVNIAGSGDAALGDLAVDNADVHIAGSGDATVAPRERADTKIAGSGDVTLVTEPHSLDTNVMGSGHVVHRAQAAPAAPAAPSAPAAPPPPAAPAAEKI